MTKTIKYLTISDIHLGNKRNKTFEIIKNLDIFFDNYKSTSQFVDLDILFIAGDLFDTLLDLSSSDIHEIILWLNRLMQFCSRFNIRLRILEGTPSHDWKQSKVAESVAKVIDNNLDFKYIDTLYIEYIKELNINVLYIPDEWTANTDLTFSQVKELMSNLNLDNVDIAIMHGLFTYQLKLASGSIQKHNEADYLSIVKYFINIGHIHNYSSYDRIIAQGSFDRLSHNEEEAKGGILCTIDPNNGNNYSFIENKNAKIFKTIVLKNKDLDKSLLNIEKVLVKLPINSFVRIKANKDHPIYIAFDELKVKFPLYYFSKTNLEEEEEYLLIDKTKHNIDTYKPISITKENIVTLLTDEIDSKYKLSNIQDKLLFQILTNLNI